MFCIVHLLEILKDSLPVEGSIIDLCKGGVVGPQTVEGGSVDIQIIQASGPGSHDRVQHIGFTDSEGHSSLTVFGPYLGEDLDPSIIVIGQRLLWLLDKAFSLLVKVKLSLEGILTRELVDKVFDHHISVRLKASVNGLLQRWVIQVPIQGSSL